MVQNIDNQKVGKLSFSEVNKPNPAGFSKIARILVLPLLLITTISLPSSFADEAVTQPVLPITEEVNPSSQDTANDQSIAQEEAVSESSELLGSGLTDATDRSVTDNTQRLEVSTGIDRAAIIAGVIATFIGFTVFAMIGVLRKLNYEKENENNDEKEVL